MENRGNSGLLPSDELKQTHAYQKLITIAYVHQFAKENEIDIDDNLPKRKRRKDVAAIRTAPLFCNRCFKSIGIPNTFNQDVVWCKGCINSYCFGCAVFALGGAKIPNEYKRFDGINNGDYVLTFQCANCNPSLKKWMHTISRKR